MIITRGHYFIDLFAGAVIAHYLWIFAEKYHYIIDEKLCKMPFNISFSNCSKEWLTCKCHP
jgi:hypothetical protein